MSSGKKRRYSKDIAKCSISNDLNARWKSRIIRKIESLWCEVKNHECNYRARYSSEDSSEESSETIDYHLDHSDFPKRKYKKNERINESKGTRRSTASVEQIDVIPDQAGPSHTSHHYEDNNISGLCDDHSREQIDDHSEMQDCKEEELDLNNEQDIICEALEARGTPVDQIEALKKKYSSLTWLSYIGRFKKWCNYCKENKINTHKPKFKNLQNFMLHEMDTGAHRDTLNRLKSALRLVFPEVQSDREIKMMIDAAPLVPLNKNSNGGK